MPLAGATEGGCLYDHPVGAGKTLLGVTLTMEAAPLRGWRGAW